jgi:hypothetical protein
VDALHEDPQVYAMISNGEERSLLRTRKEPHVLSDTPNFDRRGEGVFQIARVERGIEECRLCE